MRRKQELRPGARTNEGKMDDDTRLSRLIAAAKQSGLSLDVLHDLTHDLDSQAFRRVMGNASSMPRNSQSNGSPYFSRSTKAPLSDNL